MLFPKTSFLFAAFVLSASLLTVSADGRSGLRQVAVTGPRIMLSDVLVGDASSVVAVDLGAAPAPGGSRIIDRRLIRKALEREQITGIDKLPKAVRVVRKMEKLTRERLSQIAKRAMARTKLRRGITLIQWRPPRGVRVAAGWDTVSLRLPKPPRRQGNWSTTALLTFTANGKRLARLAIPASFAISAAGARPDVDKGAPVVLLVRRGLVEIKVQATAKSAADIGDVFSVTLRPSGRQVRAKLLEGGHALALGVGR